MVRPFKLMRSPVGGIFSKGMNIMINKLIPEHCPITEESLQYYRDCVPNWKARKAIGDFPKMIPTDGKPAASHQFALDLQAGLKNIQFPVTWLQPTPGVVASLENPIGLGRLETLKKQLPQLDIQDFGPGYHFLSEENPARVTEMVAATINALN